MVQLHNLDSCIFGERGPCLKVEKKHEKNVLNVLKYFSTCELHFYGANKELLSAKSELAFEAKYIRKDQPAAPGCSFTGVFIPYQVVQLYPNMKIAEIKYVNEKIKPLKTQESAKFKLQINDWRIYGLEVFFLPKSQQPKKR